MKMRLWSGLAALGMGLAGCGHRTQDSGAAFREPPVRLRQFDARGIVQELKPDGQTVVIAHEAISNYMAAMTMPFKVRQTNELAGLNAGDEIAFRLWVDATESWIDRIAKTGKRAVVGAATNVAPTGAIQTASGRHHLLDAKFTNELGQAVSLGDFRDQALAVTFFFTRCPIPDFCPRLSKNFEEASRQLSAMTNAPKNWHFLSVSIDPEFDTPVILKAYAERYHYDPQHWSFLTGPAQQIAELAESSEVRTRPAGGIYDHNFRTLIIDANGKLQMSFPVGGNLSDAIVSEILKATAVAKE